MSNRSLIEFNHDLSPTDFQLLEWARAMRTYFRSGDPKQLPDGATWFWLRHHTEPCPMGKPPRGWENNVEPVDEPIAVPVGRPRMLGIDFGADLLLDGKVSIETLLQRLDGRRVYQQAGPGLEPYAEPDIACAMAAAVIRKLLQPGRDTYACQSCGRRDGLDCVIPNHIWNRIEAETGHDVLCAWCLDAACASRGIQVRGLLAFVGQAISAGTEPDNADPHWERHLGDLTAQCSNAKDETRTAAARLAGARAAAIDDIRGKIARTRGQCQGDEAIASLDHILEYLDGLKPEADANTLTEACADRMYRDERPVEFAEAAKDQPFHELTNYHQGRYRARVLSVLRELGIVAGGSEQA